MFKRPPRGVNTEVNYRERARVISAEVRFRESGALLFLQLLLLGEARRMKDEDEQHPSSFINKQRSLTPLG